MDHHHHHHESYYENPGSPVRVNGKGAFEAFQVGRISRELVEENTFWSGAFIPNGTDEKLMNDKRVEWIFCLPGDKNKIVDRLRWYASTKGVYDINNYLHEGEHRYYYITRSVCVAMKDGEYTVVKIGRGVYD